MDPPNECAVPGPHLVTAEEGNRNSNSNDSIREFPGRPPPSPPIREGRWCYTCGGHLLKHESGPHCDQCIRWDRVIRGLQAAPPPRPI